MCSSVSSAVCVARGVDYTYAGCPACVAVCPRVGETPVGTMNDPVQGTPSGESVWLRLDVSATPF